MSRDTVSTTITQAPEDFNGVGAPVKLKTPLKKEELEKIAKQLKKKLSKASITAKQSFSPGKIVNNGFSLPKSSPLKSYVVKKQLGSSPIGAGLLSSSPNNLFSPNGKSPTHIRTPAAIYLSSSPLKNIAAEDTEEETFESPTKKRKSSPLKEKGPQMILEEISRPNTPSKQFPASLKPSLELTASKSDKKPKESPEQTTPTLLKKELNVNTNPNVLLKTPTQSRPSANGGAYNDEEGADLLMYLATSPSPAKPFFSNTPRAINIHHPINSTAPTSAGSLSISHKPTGSNGSSASFIAPPPVTPKRHGTNSTRTPQNRLTPSMNLFSNLINGNSGLPSSGLTLTPTGFNMNDYVNFFTPSPGGANIHSASNKNLLRTPDFNNLINNANSANGNSESGVSNGLLAKPKVDGKVLNFNKVLFGSGPGSETPKE